MIKWRCSWGVEGAGMGVDEFVKLGSKHLEFSPCINRFDIFKTSHAYRSSSLLSKIQHMLHVPNHTF